MDFHYSYTKPHGKEVCICKEYKSLCLFQAHKQPCSAAVCHQGFHVSDMARVDYYQTGHQDEHRTKLQPVANVDDIHFSDPLTEAQISHTKAGGSAVLVAVASAKAFVANIRGHAASAVLPLHISTCSHKGHRYSLHEELRNG